MTNYFKALFIIFILYINNLSFSQKIVTVYPKITDISLVCSEASRINKPNPKPEKICFTAWTWDGSPGEERTLIKFDLSEIPKNADVISAELSLYTFETEIYDNGHSTRNGSNEFYIRRITSQWDCNTTTWNSQPETTEKNQVLVHSSTKNDENYENINITELIKDIVKEPENNYGIAFMLKNPQKYRAMIFASNNNQPLNLHPKLEIKYKKRNQEAAQNIEPENENSSMTLIIIDQNMNIIKEETEIDISKLNEITKDLQPGTYLFQIIDDKSNINSFKVIK